MYVSEFFCDSTELNIAGAELSDTTVVAPISAFPSICTAYCITIEIFKMITTLKAKWDRLN